MLTPRIIPKGVDDVQNEWDSNACTHAITHARTHALTPTHAHTTQKKTLFATPRLTSFHWSRRHARTQARTPTNTSFRNVCFRLLPL